MNGSTDDSLWMFGRGLEDVRGAFHEEEEKTWSE